MRSGFEARVMDAAREYTDLLYEAVRLKFTVERTYTPDVLLPNGILIEIKGRFVAADRTKHLQVRKSNPHLDIRFVFQQNAKLRKGSKTSYGDWCDKNGFQWALNEIPLEWIEEKK